MRTIISIVFALFLASCASEEKTQITNQSDYQHFLVTEPVKLTSKYFELWNSKIKPDSMQLLSFGIVGGEYTRYFNETGDIAYLKKAEQSLKKAAEIAAIGKSGYYRALARNYISQHKFKAAFYWADKAYALGSGLQASKALLFDVHMELGNYQTAESLLVEIRNDEDFEYLIRAAKWSDYQGNLSAAIVYMERAKAKTDASANKVLKIWAYTNLADFYGHAGRIEEAYAYYLSALALDNDNAYAKKGIAWIVFSHEKNPKEALRILDQITATNQNPDYHLLKAEIASYMKEDFQAKGYLDAYYRSTQNTAYGSMYNAYTIKFYLEETQQFQKAVALAQEEVINRATPQAYDLLAYSHLKNGEADKALHLINKYVRGKTFEPEATYHMAEIYKANGDNEKVQVLKKELEDVAFEMGPAFPKLLAQL